MTLANQSAGKRELSRRRVPIQQRAFERSEQILDATSRLLDTVGFDDLTTILIAKDCGISVGTLYHYFPNKHAILHALGERWLNTVSASLAATTASATATAIDTPRSFIERVIDQLLEAYRTQQGLLPLAQAMFAIPELRELDERHDQLVIDYFTDAFESLGVRAVRNERNRLARAMLELSHALLLVTVNQPPARSKRTLNDLKRLANCLIAPYLQAD